MTTPDKLKLNNPVIVSEDIFTKAAEDYLRKVEPRLDFARLRISQEREHMVELAERINSLKKVGAI